MARGTSVKFLRFLEKLATRREIVLTAKEPVTEQDFLHPPVNPIGPHCDANLFRQEIIERWRVQSGAPTAVPIDRVRDFSVVKEAAREPGIR